MNCKVVAVLIAILAIALMASADTIVDSNTTTEGTTATVDAGNGQTFTCDSLLNQAPGSATFSCNAAPSGFTCYGWSNCTALGATVGWVLVKGIPTLDQPTGVPEPNSLLLLASGFLALVVLQFRRQIHA